MPITARQIQLEPSATGERPPPIPGRSSGYSSDLGLIQASQLDEDSIILLPNEYIMDEPAERDEYLDASWRDGEGAGRCWQTTVIYEEQINETHPHLVP
jgi:hypothetical protein